MISAPLVVSCRSASFSRSACSPRRGARRASAGSSWTYGPLRSSQRSRLSGLARRLREERAHQRAKRCTAALRACGLRLVVLLNREGESHVASALVTVVLVHWHGCSSLKLQGPLNVQPKVSGPREYCKRLPTARRIAPSPPANMAALQIVAQVGEVDPSACLSERLHLAPHLAFHVVVHHLHVLVHHLHLIGTHLPVFHLIAHHLHLTAHHLHVLRSHRSGLSGAHRRHGDHEHHRHYDTHHLSHSAPPSDSMGHSRVSVTPSRPSLHPLSALRRHQGSHNPILCHRWPLFLSTRSLRARSLTSPSPSSARACGRAPCRTRVSTTFRRHPTQIRTRPSWRPPPCCRAPARSRSPARRAWPPAPSGATSRRHRRSA